MKLNKSSFQYLFVFLLSVATLTAQTVSGTVSGADGSALAGANVAVEGTDMGASSNNDGSFSIYQFALGDDEVDYDIIQQYGRTVGKEKIEKNTHHI